MTGLDEQHPEVALDDLTVYGEPYGVARERVDGMDVEAVYRAAAEAIERGRAGGGPSLIECVAYRFEGHHEGDSEFYREDGELDEWTERDPLETYPRKLVDEGVLTEADYEQMEAEIEDEIEDAIEFARESDFPEPAAAYEGLYSDGGERA